MRAAFDEARITNSPASRMFLEWLRMLQGLGQSQQ
jgi:hypothetical protein